MEQAAYQLAPGGYLRLPGYFKNDQIGHGPLPGVGPILGMTCYKGVVFASRAREDGQGNDIWLCDGGKWQLLGI